MNHLLSIHEYTAQHSKLYADRLIDRTVCRCELIEQLRFIKGVGEDIQNMFGCNDPQLFRQPSLKQTLPVTDICWFTLAEYARA